ncbi:MAG: DNA-processing protein DprA [Ilumatobacteraceae bacterium]
MSSSPARRVGDYDESTVAAALASLSGVGPARLRTLVVSLGAHDAWRTVRGELPARDHIAALLHDGDLGRLWRREATLELLERTATALHASKMQALLINDPEYPSVLRGDHAAPVVLFARGNLAVCATRRVGIIGTRAASAAGRHFARRLGTQLAAAGVAVVSGLARGIDAAAHRGVLELTDTAPTDTSSPGAPIGVVASGLDVVYPREHSALWHDVASRGVLLSESPPGCKPDAFRFPLRNRMLAALSEVLVVVESRVGGGSMITVEEAAKRSITVMAVPGSPHVATSEGANLLLAQGCAPVCSVDDILVALGLDHRRTQVVSDPRPKPTAADRRVVDTLLARPLTFDDLFASLEARAIDVALSLGRLEAGGWVTCTAGWWEALLVA